MRGRGGAEMAAGDRARRRRLHGVLGLLVLGAFGPVTAHHVVGDVVTGSGGAPAVSRAAVVPHAATHHEPGAERGVRPAPSEARRAAGAVAASVSTPPWSAVVEGDLSTHHLGALCRTALEALLAWVHGTLHVLLAVGVLVAAWDRWAAWRRLRRVLGRLRAYPPRPAGPIWRAARAAHLSVARVRVVAGLENPAFTVGWVRPVVYVAAELAERITPRELRAVLAHEAAHVRRRDPLRLSTLRFLGAVVFWLPALRRLADDLADEVEFQADDAAAGDAPLVLAGALVAVASAWRVPTLAPRRWWPPAALEVVGFTTPDLLERRVLRLAGEPVPACSRLTRWSTTGAVAALALVAASGVATLRPLSAPTRCAQHREAAWTHLWCEPAGAAEHCLHVPAGGGDRQGAGVHTL